MAQQKPVIEFEDIPRRDARRMSRGPKMDPQLYTTLKAKFQSLGTTAVRMNLPEGASPSAMENRILPVADELNVTVTIRRVPGGLLFWRSTDEALQQAKDVAQRLQAARQLRQSTPRRRRRRAE
jgi:hypothetical protein